jgi:hypothetical protein
MTNTATSTTTLPSGSRIELDEMTPGLWRIALWSADGKLVNRYRDISVARLADKYDALVAEDAS